MKHGAGMTPSVPRVLLMCLALAFASFWLGCGPEPTDGVDAWAPDVDVDAELSELPCACGENEDAD